MDLSPAEVTGLVDAEKAMRAVDAEMQQIAEQRNAIESYVLEMRNAPHTKHGACLGEQQVKDLNALLEAAEDWLYSEEAAEASLEGMQGKRAEVESGVSEVCREYLDKVAADKRAVELELEEEMKRAAAAREAEGDDNKAEKDSRRLPKAERMRKVTKHKQTGAVDFKEKNYKEAVKHYKEAYTHCSKFFDLSPEGEEEVKHIKVSLLLNLAQCWVKLGNMDQVFKCAGDALVMEPLNCKALMRRAMVYESRKEYELAKKDIELGLEQPSGANDKALLTLQKRVTILQKKEKAKEKKMWGKAFS